MQKRNLTLFHGTSVNLVKLIKDNGFSITKNKHLAYGPGIYCYQTLERAQQYSSEKFEEDGCVIRIDIEIPEEKYERFERFRLDSLSANQETITHLYVIDASVDDGIFVIKPNALHLIRIS